MRADIDRAIRDVESSDHVPVDWYPPSFWVPEAMLEMQAEILQRVRDLRDTRAGCALANADPDALSFLVAPGDRAAGLKEIRDFSRDAESLIVVDPYLFAGSNRDAEARAQELIKNARLDRLRALNVITNPNYGANKSIRRRVRDAASTRKCGFTEGQSDKIHDRIWIKDGKEAIVVGTSFGGIGNRLAFILPLPSYDLRALLEFLRSERLL